jgi:hypothetical protein
MTTSEYSQHTFVGVRFDRERYLDPDVKAAAEKLTFYEACKLGLIYLMPPVKQSEIGIRKTMMRVSAVPSWSATAVATAA